MEDARLESVRTLMRSALEEAAGFGVGDAQALHAQAEKERILLEAELSLARAGWEKEREALKGSIRALERKSEDLAQSRLSQGREMDLARSAWEKEKSLLEDGLLRARIDLEQEKAEAALKAQALNLAHARADEASREKVAALTDLLQKEQRRSAERLKELEARLAVERARGDRTGELRVRVMEEELDQAAEGARREADSLRAQLASEKEKLSAAQEDWRRQREEMLRGLDEEFKVKWQARQDWLKERAALQARIAALEGLPPPALPEAPPPPPDASPALQEEKPEASPWPALEPVLDPAWGRIVALLKPRLANSTSYLRRLAAAKMPEGQRALLRMAAGDIVQASDHLKIIEQFLEGASPPPTPGRLEAAAAAALAQWERAFRLRGLTFARRFEGTVGPALFHPATLRVALYQVIRNAFEAMPRGGCLTVRLEPDPPTEGVRLSFSDTGPGLSPEAQAELFVPFASTKKNHLGLGLALTRQMLQSWGGEVEVSNGKVGALVALRFPASAAAPGLTEPAA